MVNQSQVMNPVHVMHRVEVNQSHQVPRMVNWSNGVWMPIGSQLQRSSLNESVKILNAMNRDKYPVHNFMPRNLIGRRETAGMKSGRLGLGGGYMPTTHSDLQNRLKARRFYQKKKFNRNKTSVPSAPLNTTSFLIRAKRSGGIADSVSPYPVTPAILPTPKLSPSRDVLSDMVKEEWGVDGYGSMNGLIRLKSPENEDMESSIDSNHIDDEHTEMEKRLDHDLSRFQMINPTLENRVTFQGNQISELEKDNSLLREKLHLMENEMNNLKNILQNLEIQNIG